LAERGMTYGPAARLLCGAWRLDGQALVEVALDRPEDAGGFLVHPALLDAALHGALALAAGVDADTQLPFSWSDVRLAPGRSPRSLRLRIGANPSGGFELTGHDEGGAPALAVGLVRTRPLGKLAG
jgi:hypothetical protein